MDNSRFFSGRNLTISGGLFIALMVLIQGPWIGAGAVAAAAPGAAIPDMLFSYDPESLSPMFVALGDAGRTAYLTMNLVDFFFAAAYGLLYLVALGWIAEKLFPRIPALRLLGLIGVLGALADETENVIFRLIASGASDGGEMTSRIAAVVSPLKYSCIYFTMALIAIGLAAVAVKAIAGKIGTKRA